MFIKDLKFYIKNIKVKTGKKLHSIQLNGDENRSSYLVVNGSLKKSQIHKIFFAISKFL